MISITFPEGTIVDIEDHVLQLFHAYTQNHLWDKEAGGVLLAKQIENRSHFVISAASTPTKWDKRSRFSFVRSIKSAQPFINERWETSGGTENYFGEWHTHPESFPTPSGIDKSLINQIIEDKSSPYSKVLLIIVGQIDSFFIGLADSVQPELPMVYRKIEVDYEHIRIKK